MAPSEVQSSKRTFKVRKSAFNYHATFDILFTNRPESAHFYIKDLHEVAKDFVTYIKEIRNEARVKIL